MIDERLAELRRGSSELRAACEAAVRRVEFGDREELWVPSPPLPPRANAAPPHHVPEPAPGSWSLDRLAGLDEHGRAVLVRRARGHHDEPPAPVLAFPSEEAEADDEYGGVTGLGHLLLTWDGPRVEVVRFVTHDHISELCWIDLDADGRPVTFTRTGDRGASVTTCTWDGDRCVTQVSDGVVRTGEYDAAGLVRVRQGERVLWERRFDGFEHEPLPETEALEAWAAAVVAAAERAVAGVTGAAAIKVRAEPSSHEWPRAFIVDEAYVRRAERRVGRDEAIWRHWGRRIDLIDLIDDAGLRARRSLLQDDDLYVPQFPAILQRHLDGRSWPEGAVALGHRAPEDVPAEEPAAVGGPPRDEAELAALIARFDLPDELLGTARWGLALVDGDGRSRLGGPPELPGEWPRHDGRRLSHVATIAFEELPDIPGREQLPADGTLVFLAALDEEDELVEAAPASDPRIHLVHLPAGTPTRRLEGEDENAMEERRVRLLPVLTLPGRRDDLALDLQLGYERLVEALAAVTPGLWRPAHLLLGHPNFAHWDPRGPDEINVLHFGFDYDLSIDGRQFTVHGRAEDVLAGRWERLTVTPQH